MPISLKKTFNAPSISPTEKVKTENITIIGMINNRLKLIGIPRYIIKKTNRRKPARKLTNSVPCSEIGYKSFFTFNDFINSDIIITTHQFIMNFKFNIFKF
jgi:hypothetical protein